MTTESIEFNVPFYNFSVVVTPNTNGPGYLATDNGHTEITLLSKFDTFFIPPSQQAQLLKRLHIEQTPDREFQVRLYKENVHAEDAAKMLIAGILYLAVHREYGQSPYYGMIEIG